MQTRDFLGCTSTCSVLDFLQEGPYPGPSVLGLPIHSKLRKPKKDGTQSLKIRKGPLKLRQFRVKGCSVQGEKR